MELSIFLLKSSTQLSANIKSGFPYIRISCHAFQDEQIDASRKYGQTEEDEKKREEHVARLIGKPVTGLGRYKITKTDCGN